MGAKILKEMLLLHSYEQQARLSITRTKETFSNNPPLKILVSYSVKRFLLFFTGISFCIRIGQIEFSLCLTHVLKRKYFFDHFIVTIHKMHDLTL